MTSKIQKMALTLAIIQTFMLSACSMHQKEEIVEKELTIEENIDNYLPVNLINTEFYDITENKENIILAYTEIYDYDGSIIGYTIPDSLCTAVATNDEYTLIYMENEGESLSGFVKNEVLVPKPIETVNTINSYHYLIKDAYLFSDKSFNNPINLIEMYQKVFVLEIDNDWAYVLTDTLEYGYMETYLLEKLPDLFVEVDISEQLTSIFQNDELIYSTANVTGKDATPTDLGYFDIDDKVQKTYLRAYLPNGSLEYETYVDYWMPYNGGEGLHDAPWQNAHFGSKDYYHYGGSHGCVNVPATSAKEIFEKVDIGTRVLVHK